MLQVTISAISDTKLVTHKSKVVCFGILINKGGSVSIPLYKWHQINETVHQFRPALGCWVGQCWGNLLSITARISVNKLGLYSDF